MKRMVQNTPENVIKLLEAKVLECETNMFYLQQNGDTYGAEMEDVLAFGMMEVLEYFKNPGYFDKIYRRTFFAD